MKKSFSLGEGSTPLIRSRRIGPDAGCSNLYFKLESGNPTGSYKDRFAAAAISGMIENGQSTCVATSSGNTGAALAAYCAAAGFRCRIAVLETTPTNKLRQMMVYGADIFRVKNFGMDPEVTMRVLDLTSRLGSAPQHAHQISAYAYSPVGMQGVESISFELAEQLPEASHVFSPGGGGGLTLAVARGYRGCKSPAIHVVQPEGNDTMAGPLRDGAMQARDVQCSSEISGLQVASVIDGNEVIAECRPTGGTGHVVSDQTIWEVQSRLAREEGIFCEPAGAVALAGALQSIANREIDKNDAVVCLVTGSGFKVVESLEAMTKDSSCPTIDIDELAKEVDGEMGDRARGVS